MTRIAIAGGGIAGLSVAWALRARDPGLDVVVLERGERPGGNIRTERVDGYTCEAGPDGFLDNAPDTLRLVHEIGLAPRLQPSRDTARRRFILRGRTLCEVPSGPAGLVTTPLLSAAGKARVLAEPFARRRPAGVDESILGFATRRIGAEAAEVFVDAMVTGVFAGDSRALSLQACFPRMYELEAEHGGLVRALVARAVSGRRQGSVAGPGGRLTSFAAGMSELPDALARALGPALRLRTPVVGIRPRPGDGYALTTPAGEVEADALVLAGHAADAAALLRDMDEPLASLLTGIDSAPLAVVCLGYDAAAFVDRPLDGFGFLVPRREGVRILGVLWETSIYPDRAPEGKALLRVMIGGARDRRAVALDDGELLGEVMRDVERTMRVTAAPEFTRIIRHGRGIPQYVTGHRARLDAIESRLRRHARLHLCGNSYRGVSINSCIAEADRVASEVLAALPQAACV